MPSIRRPKRRWRRAIARRVAIAAAHAGYTASQIQDAVAMQRAFPPAAPLMLNYLCGRSIPNVDDLEEIASALGVTRRWLELGTPTPGLESISELVSRDIVAPDFRALFDLMK